MSVRISEGSGRVKIGGDADEEESELVPPVSCSNPMMMLCVARP